LRPGKQNACAIEACGRFIESHVHQSLPSTSESNIGYSCSKCNDGPYCQTCYLVEKRDKRTANEFAPDGFVSPALQFCDRCGQCWCQVCAPYFDIDHETCEMSHAGCPFNEADEAAAASPSNAASPLIEHVGLVEPTPEQHRMIEEQFAEKWHHPEEPLPRILRVWAVRNSPGQLRAFEDHQAAVEATLGEVSRPPFPLKRDNNGDEYREVMRADAVENVLANTRRRFHGTSSLCDIGRDASRRNPCRDARCVVCSILRTGFRLPTRGGLRFGYGIYTTATSSKAHAYTNPPPEEKKRTRNERERSARVRAIFVVHVVAGNTCNRFDSWTPEDMQLTAPPPGFDSVLGRVAVNWEGGAVDDAGYECSKARHKLNYDELVTYTPDATLPAFLVLYDSHDCAEILDRNHEIKRGLIPNVHHSISRSNAGGFGRHPSQSLTAGWETWPQVESGDWRWVYVTEGECAGQFAYYDDEDDDVAYEGEGATIHIGQPLTGDAFCVPLRWLRKPPFEAPTKAYGDVGDATTAAPTAAASSADAFDGGGSHPMCHHRPQPVPHSLGIPRSKSSAVVGRRQQRFQCSSSSNSECGGCGQELAHVQDCGPNPDHRELKAAAWAAAGADEVAAFVFGQTEATIGYKCRICRAGPFCRNCLDSGELLFCDGKCGKCICGPCMHGMLITEGGSLYCGSCIPAGAKDFMDDPGSECYESDDY
jgi:hypothetical protein